MVSKASKSVLEGQFLLHGHVFEQEIYYCKENETQGARLLLVCERKIPGFLKKSGI